LTFSWDNLDSAATALDRLRETVYDWGEPGQLDGGWVDKFVAEVNDDLNVPRGLAVAWELSRSDMPDADKKATILKFDEVLGLRLAEWMPASVPESVMAWVKERESARQDKAWARADELRDKILEAGYEVRDTPEGPVVRKLN
jgi:cysteinyl-tRNA synthetase